MFYKTYHLKFDRYKSKKKSKNKHKLGESYVVVRVPFWKSIPLTISERTLDIEKNEKCHCFLTSISRIK